MPGPRIASLLPSSTEIAFALGLGDNVVGVSHECDFPAGANGLRPLTASSIDSEATGAEIDAQVREQLSAGLSLYTVDEAALVDVRPDVVLTQDTCQVCAVPFADVQASVRKVLGDHVVVLSLSPSTVEDVLGDITRVANATGVSARGEEVVGELRARLDRLRETTAPLPRRTVLHLEWLEPPMVAGHWTPS